MFSNNDLAIARYEMRIIRYIINYIGEFEVADPFQILGGEKDGCGGVSV